MKHYLSILSFVIVPLFCLSQETNPEDINLTFRRISPVGGYTYSAINSIGEDADGLIWFGTVHGLYSYNTVDVQKFVSNPLDSTTIPGNSIRTIFCDSYNTLWIGTHQGVCTYDKSKNHFIRHVFQDLTGEYLGHSIHDIIQGDSSTIYFLSATMLGKLNLQTNQFTKIFTNKSLNENFSCAVYDQKETILIGGTNGSVWKYDLANKKINSFYNRLNESVGKIYVAKSGIWIGYDWAGVDYLDLSGKFISYYSGSEKDENRINHDRVRDIFEDENGRIWISTYKGISIISNGKIYNVQPQEISGIPYNSIYRIFRDSKNGIWISTWSGGLAYQSKFDNWFIHTRKEQSYNEINDEFVSSFTEKTDGTIIVGTEFGTLNKLDKVSNKMINIPFKTENRKKIENIKSLLFDDSTQTLWVGTFLDGLWYQNKNENVLHRFEKINDSRVSIYSLIKSDSLLFIGTYGQGLYVYNLYNGNLNHYISDANDSSTISNNNIRTIIVAIDKSIWIGTKSGLNHFDYRTKTFKRFNFSLKIFNGISSDEIFSLHPGRDGLIWIGTSGGGLNKYDPITDKFESYQIKDGLVGNDVYGIEEDNNGLIWISTENGITNFDPYKINFRNFYRESELQGNQFNPGASFKTSNNEILFGDSKGITFFIPEKMKTNPFPPKVVITSLTINNVTVTNKSENSPLTNTIQTEKELKLSFRQNSLRLNFVANNYLFPNKNQFKYRLVNYDKNWIEVGNQNFASYTKIPTGYYIFEVIASNNDNLWSNIPTQLKIRILPPFWLSWYAYLIYLFILGLIGYLIRNWILERQQLKKELLFERFAHESEVQLQELKLRFFTNISHEFRTPLTLIASPVNHILEKFSLDKEVREQLQTVQRNTGRLLRLINQIIDIRKIEVGKAVLKSENVDLIDLCRDVISNFDAELKDKQIQLSFSPEKEKIIAFIDAEKVEKIFFNILGNAIKFTPENGNIGISIFRTNTSKLPTDSEIVGNIFEGEAVCVMFTDDGSGIPTDEIKLIFERFGQGSNNKSDGTGIGLHMAYEYIRLHNGNIRVKSEPGNGTQFAVCFPVVEQKNLSVVKSTPEIVDVIMGKKEKESNNSNIESNQTRQNLTILVIEDNFELRDYLKRFLSIQYQVVCSSNGKLGIETALTILPDLVISDIMMPQMDGLEVCRQLKENVQTCHIPVILLTALNESEKQIDGFKTGADAFITKPFNENILLAQVDSILLSRKKLKESFSASEDILKNGTAFFSSNRLLLEKATRFVEKHLNDENFVVDDLADHLGISPSSLYRKLKELTSQSPTEFVRYIRLKNAIKLMDYGNTNLDEIADAVGFNSHSYFTTSFKKQYGKTPSEHITSLKLKSHRSLNLQTNNSNLANIQKTNL
jgi:signal transduction histidine kinase/DNA-binding response OmpR family regulator/ligand-binding sensor domain-containing protein